MSIILFLLWWSSTLADTPAKYLYQTKYIEVPVDQFSFTTNQTFKLRYLFNDSYFEPKTGPIIFHPGGNTDIRMYAKNYEFVWEIAKQLQALVVFAEHRYYGTSLPFGNKSLTEPKYFGYLTSQQALADFVDVINHVKYEKKLTFTNSNKSNKYSHPVIALGTSYSGMLAAWMRMKYPAVIEGCLASSAPIWLFTGMLSSCSSYYEKITEIFNQSSSQCVENIKKSWRVIDKIATRKNGRKWISKEWRLCKPIESESDRTNLKHRLSNIYDLAAAFNYPYASDFLEPLPGNPVSAMCKPLRKSIRSKTKLLRALFKAVSVYTNYTGKSRCFDFNGGEFGGRTGWNIQECSELVFPDCSTGKTDMFLPMKWNFEDYDKKCFKAYHVHPQERLMGKWYGGKSIEAASNIIFSNGDQDPCIVGGVTKSISKTVVAVVIQGAAHNLDLRKSHPKDLKSVIKARKFYIETFKKWIQDYHKRHYLQ